MSCTDKKTTHAELVMVVRLPSSLGKKPRTGGPSRGFRFRLGGTCDGIRGNPSLVMSEGKPITTIALLPLCYPSNTSPFLLRGHFVAPVQPRFTNFLASEIRAKTFVTGE